MLDYGSFLETLTNDDLITLITSQSGDEGIEDFKDGEAFEEWYNGHKSDSLDNLRPVRMVLVGLGVDDRASRIVKLLQSGIDISLLIFHGFSHDGATILARHVEAEFDNRRKSHSRRSNDRRNPASYEALSRTRNSFLSVGWLREHARVVTHPFVRLQYLRVGHERRRLQCPDVVTLPAGTAVCAIRRVRSA